MKPMQFVYSSMTETIRLMPQNHTIAIRRDTWDNWVVNCDPAVRTEVATLAFVAVHESHDLAWGDGMKLAAELNKKAEF